MSNHHSLLDMPQFALDDPLFSQGETNEQHTGNDLLPSHTFIQIMPDHQDIFSFINNFTNHDTNHLITEEEDENSNSSISSGTTLYNSTNSPISTVSSTSSGATSPTNSNTASAVNRKNKRKYEEIEQDNLRLEQLLKIPNHELTPEEKEEKRKLRNRCTAKRSRDERKNKIEELTCQNQQLQQQVKSLQSELITYKNKVIQMEDQVLNLQYQLQKPQVPNKKYYSILFVVVAVVFVCMTTINIGIHTKGMVSNMNGIPSLADFFYGMNTTTNLMQKGRSLLHHGLDTLKPKTTPAVLTPIEEHDENIIAEEEFLVERHLMDEEAMPLALANHYFVLNREKHEQSDTIQLMTPLHHKQQQNTPTSLNVDYQIYIPIEIKNDPFHSNEKCIRVVQYHVSKDSNPSLYNKLMSVTAQL